MTSAEQIDIIQLPRRAAEGSASEASGAEPLSGWPEGWPEGVVLALRRDTDGLSLMPCHAEESADMIIARLAHVEGRAPALYRVYPTVMAEAHKAAIAQLLREDEDLFERAEEFALNYEFMRPPEPVEPIVEPAAAQAPDDRGEASPHEDYLPMGETLAAVALEDLILELAEDGGAVLRLPGGEGQWQAPLEALGVSADGANLRLDLDLMYREGLNAAEVILPAQSFTFLKCEYSISRRCGMLYFRPKAEALSKPQTRTAALLANRPLQLAALVIALLIGVVIGQMIPQHQPLPAPKSTVEQLRQSMFAPTDANTAKE